ncbi:MAG: 30S ribosomal protein S3ae [Candidatus Bathyarchaeia archaeon]
MPRKKPRKVKDKWRSKTWYAIYAPSYFGGRKITETIADDPSKLVGRIVETSLYELTGDLTRDYVTLRFQINEVKEGGATTVFQGHRCARDFIRVKVRRRRSLVEEFYTVRTKDAHELRLDVVVITPRKITADKAKAVRRIIREVLDKKSEELSYGELTNEIILEKLSSDLREEIRKVTPLDFIEVVRSKLIRVAG